MNVLISASVIAPELKKTASDTTFPALNVVVGDVVEPVDDDDPEEVVFPSASR